jgi:large subunit ribosomal protein L13
MMERRVSSMLNKTPFPSERSIVRDWWIADASGEVLGRLASTVADCLRGKTKPGYTPFLDTGDFVVVVNAGKIRLTGKKADQKMYFRHSGYPGGIKQVSAGDRLQHDPHEMIRDAVKGMLPHTKLGRRLITKLKVYTGPDHPHAAQQPRPLAVSVSSRQRRAARAAKTGAA